jgi:acyl-CoA thioester hydrolase
MQLADFPVKHVLRIDWSELDYFKHVNNVSFFKYIQSARVNYWDRVGLTASHLATNIGPMLASVHCEFKKPLFYPGEVVILTRTEFIKNSSFGFHHLLLDTAGDLCAEAQDVMVMYDFNLNQKTPFPQQFRDAIALLENKTF